GDGREARADEQERCQIPGHDTITHPGGSTSPTIPGCTLADPGPAAPPVGYRPDVRRIRTTTRQPKGAPTMPRRTFRTVAGTGHRSTSARGRPTPDCPV